MISTTEGKRLSLKEAAQRILEKEGKPLHYREILKRILYQGWTSLTTKTPEASLNAVITVDIKSQGQKSLFVRYQPGIYGLRSFQDDKSRGTLEQVPGQETRRVRIPLFPVYSEVRAVLPVWDGRPRSQITGLRASIAELRGTPQAPEDWTEPDTWIPERLSGPDEDLARAVWEGTGKRVNPRHVYGHWLLACTYRLLVDDGSGVMRLSKRGSDFVAHPRGTIETELDEGEGLIKLLAIVAEKGPARLGHLVEPWSDYLKRRSRFGTDSTFRDTLRRRLQNLLERSLVSRSGTLYSITDKGLAYLNQAGDDDVTDTDEEQRIRTLVKEHETAVRDSIHELLYDMNPFAFEHLIKQLLEAMNYHGVEVTKPSNDKGVDVVGDIELGISSVREVVQAKRHRKTIQRKDLDALRGSLHRFQAVRGTLISTSRFSRGTQEAAFEHGAAPITLIDGKKLIDLLIEHGIGVRKRSIEILELDASAFTEMGIEDERDDEEDG